MKNDQEKFNSELIKHYLDKNLSLGKIDNACEIFSIIKTLPENEYILKYKIYCLIQKNQKEIAQLQYDLIKEAGFKDNFFFDKSFNYLMGYNNNSEIKISQENLLNFHLSYLSIKIFHLNQMKILKKLFGSICHLIIY